MNLHEHARAEAEKRFPERFVKDGPLADYYDENAGYRGVYAAGFLAGHETATRTREVTTVTELDALADRTCIIDADMEFHQRHGTLLDLDRTVESAWLGFLSPTLRAASEIRLPARVLYDPEETP